jgi:hypothetical protein
LNNCLAREVQAQNQGLSEVEAANVAGELTHEAIDSLVVHGNAILWRIGRASFFACL